MNQNIDIVVIGSIIKETIKFPDREIGPVIGSPAAYASLVIAAQGLKVGLVTYYGNDMQKIISELDVLDKRGILPFAYTTTNLLVYRTDGTKYVEYQQSAPALRFENIHPEYLKANYFKICPMNYEVDLEIVKALHRMEKVVFVDLGGYGGATSDVRHSVETAYGQKVIHTLCKHATVIKASQEDLASIVPGKTVEEAADYLTKAGAKHVVVTLGSNGAMYRTGTGSLEYADPMPAVSEMPDSGFDYTGAGDSFGAGFMVSYVQNQDIRQAVINGNATASLVIQKSGGCTFARMPQKKQVDQRIRQGIQNNFA